MLVSGPPATLRAPPRVGDAAPKLELVTGKGPDGHPTWFRLHEAIQNGPIVVAFFPGTFTSTCADEMACFTRDWNLYAQSGAQFIGVSVDSVPSQRAWAKQHQYQVPFGSDFERRATYEWGVAAPFWWGTVSKRATFIVDRLGVVRYADVQTNSDLEPRYEEIQATLKTLA
jgi:glutaredoxin-dependent peroxiredoxin